MQDAGRVIDEPAMSRISPVAREVIVPTAMSALDRRTPERSSLMRVLLLVDVAATHEVHT